MCYEAFLVDDDKYLPHAWLLIFFAVPRVSLWPQEQVRALPEDNKWYASFSSPENGRVPQRGELWETFLFARIDDAG